MSQYAEKLFTSLIILIGTLGNIEIHDCLQFYDKT